MRKRQPSLTISSDKKNMILENLNLKYESCEQEKKEYLTYFINNNFENIIPEIDLNEENPKESTPYVKASFTGIFVPKKVIKSKIKISSKAHLVNKNKDEFQFVDQFKLKLDKKIDLKLAFADTPLEELESLSIDDLLNCPSEEVEENLKRCDLFLDIIKKNKNKSNNNFDDLQKYFTSIKEKLLDFSKSRNYALDSFEKINSIIYRENGNVISFK